MVLTSYILTVGLWSTVGRQLRAGSVGNMYTGSSIGVHVRQNRVDGGVYQNVSGCLRASLDFSRCGSVSGLREP
ncbi:hypothetical protein PF005_g8244 [Phytophthora fragariae]|uniref:Pectate lyase n=1 Tax=Phytophthora fragariae TaxID=53985 RepID=A0A6A3YGI6_9STRA|nr:hypothetical protein PF003_g7803 [Phytophthora fragariae]KAE8940584.1 hypothetical protein PF009_g9617 [Phytophthora fragariae]KAE9014340.1 hypothetical protein PF011_g8111 [Phytophthora fragariae]KAE9065929.1 hypothetical protein PF007_g28670 [Phytophthora fragariae]KAE9119626.1 hypothetical protein PF010_g7802 [Phytophthora fragariae]